ncbi:MAG: hypothetical protein IJS65_06375 [Clostridia bacterium]|nr:hypothetical protein [Clostridia bacterium]
MFFEPKVKVNRLASSEKDVNIYLNDPVKKGMIVFYGDSGFTRWKSRYGNPNLEDVILRKDGSQAVVNHGFGTSTAEEQLYYYPMLIRPWEPRALVLKAAGNDFAAGYSPLDIISLHARIMEYARTDFPGIKLYFCNSGQSLKSRESTASRKKLAAEYNELVADYCAKHEDTTLVDLFNVPEKYKDPSKVGDPEYIREELYVEDKVHFNPEGYKIYEKVFKEALADIL